MNKPIQIESAKFENVPFTGTIRDGSKIASNGRSSELRLLHRNVSTSTKIISKQISFFLPDTKNTRSQRKMMRATHVKPAGGNAGSTGAGNALPVSVNASDE
jgi:hypothetical protein